MHAQPSPSIDIIFSVVIGGAITLAGTFLATILEARKETRSRNRERLLNRYREVRRFIRACLEFADIAYQPRKLGSALFGPSQYREWLEDIRSNLQEWKTLPVRGSARVLYVDDEKLLEHLTTLDNLTLLFYLNAKELFEKGRMADLDDKFSELDEVAKAASSRLDELILKA